MNHTTEIRAVAVEDIHNTEQPGAFRIKEPYFECVCPCGCGAFRAIPIDGPRKWTWDGNRTEPSLTPSIRDVGRCYWHGYLTKGVWIPQPDSGVKA